MPISALDTLIYADGAVFVTMLIDGLVGSANWHYKKDWLNDRSLGSSMTLLVILKQGSR
jgi:hypothetical protein